MPAIKQFFDPAHDSLIPEIASDEELAAANSFLSIASFGSTAIGFAGAGLLAGTVGLTMGVHHRRRDVRLRGRLHRPDGPPPDADARRRCERAVIVDNLKSGMATLFGTPIIRSLFAVGALMFFSFGLWNVLLLPFSLQVLGATEFQYGLQEGLTSVGFVAGSFFMARFSRLLPEPVWIIVAMIGMGVCGRAVRPVDRGRGRDRPGDDHRLLQRAVVDRALRAAPAQHARARCAVASSPRSTSCATSSSCSAWPAPAWPTSSTSGS